MVAIYDAAVTREDREDTSGPLPVPQRVSPAVANVERIVSQLKCSWRSAAQSSPDCRACASKHAPHCRDSTREVSEAYCICTSTNSCY